MLSAIPELDNITTRRQTDGVLLSMSAYFILVGVRLYITLTTKVVEVKIYNT